MVGDKTRQVKNMNITFNQLLSENRDLIFLGEDILSPYGGAFKATRDLSNKHSSRLYNTPISEAAIAGIANGLAIRGKRPVYEIMFGDFITLCFDQMVNHISKYKYMYDEQVKCPLTIRTPMGSGRGYGPCAAWGSSPL